MRLRRSVSRQGGIGKDIHVKGLAATAGTCHQIALNGPKSGGVVWQRKLKGCAPPGIGAGPQTTAMGLYDPATDGQSHTGSLRFRGEERLEKAFEVLAGKSNAGVTPRNQQSPVFGPL